MSPIAVYVHTPFCPSKCGYCDFNSYAMTGEIMARTTAATVEEIRRSPWRGRPAKTIFFGGGTPTFLDSGQLISILDAVLEAHPPLSDAEITSEANPGTVDMPKFGAMRQAGFNRISLGAQSFLEGDLITLGRIHRVGEIERAVGAARDAGFDNVNLDLMFALPGQGMQGWKRNVERAIALDPQHLSLYCLTIEPNTAFYKKNLRGELDLPDDECQVEMYDFALEASSARGYLQYEVSNFAKPGKECRHNLAYWHGDEYAGYGPGAVGCVDLRRYTNLKHPEHYCDAVEAQKPVAFESENLDDSIKRTERIMLGLRLNEGLKVEGLGLTSQAIGDMVDRGWINADQGRIRMTDAGRHFCSEIALALI